MATLNVTNTFTAGTIIKSSEVNQNFSDIVSWGNGNISDTNFGTMTGTITWSVTTNNLSINSTNTGNAGSVSIAHNGTLATSKSAVKITSNAAQSLGTAIVNIEATSVSNAIPALRISDSGSGSPAFQVISKTK